MHFGPTEAMDYELEMAVWIAGDNALGEPVPMSRAPDRIFGYGLLNDWSVRDVQRWEMPPLGPFLGKSVSTSVSPWIVTAEALAPFEAPAPVQEPPALPYLDSAWNRSNGALSVRMTAAILTPRLRLRPLAEKDLDQLVTLIGDWEVARWLARVPHPYGAEDARKFIGEVGRRMAQMRELHYGIALRDEDLLIGGMGLVAGDQSDELGYWIGRPYWGRGYAGEAVPPLLSLAFNRLQRTRVFARILPDNHASRRLLEKLGFSYEGDRLTHFPIRARDMMLPHYEMTSALWQARYGTESPTGEDE